MLLSIFNNTLRLIAGLALGYQVVVFYFFLFQDQFIYSPDRNVRNPSRFGLYNVVDEVIKSWDGTEIQVWYGKPEGGRPIIVYFQAGNGSLNRRKDLFQNVIEQGYGLMAISYRGFGRSEGKPSEQGIYSDARSAISYLRKKGYKESDMIFYGESMGAGVAVQMATEYRPLMVVLESPYTSVADIVRWHYPYIPARHIIWDSFDALTRIRDIHAPLLIMYGTDDSEVPEDFPRILTVAAKEPKKTIYFAGIEHLEIKGSRIMQEIASFDDDLELVKDGHYSKVVKR